MKNLIIILAFSVLMIGCKKQKEEPDTVLVVIVKKSDGSLAQVASTSVSGCYNSDGQTNGCQLASGSTVNGFTEMDGRLTINNARTDVYYEVDASLGGEIVIYYHPSKLTPHTTNYITVTMHP